MKMIGTNGHPPCGSKCCGDIDRRKHKRLMKRRERNEWKKEARNV